MPSSVEQTGSNFKKYRSLITYIAFFVLLGVVVLIVSFLSNMRQEKISIAVSASSNQDFILRNLSASITTAYLASEALGADNGAGLGADKVKEYKGEIAASVADVKKAEASVDSLIEALDKGGRAYPDIPRSVTSALAKGSPERNALENFKTIWLEHKAQIDRAAPDAPGGAAGAPVNAQALRALKKFDDEEADSLRSASLALHNALHERRESFARSVLMTQGGILGLDILLFLLVLFNAVKSLARSDEKTRAAREETEQIMSTVQEGLFLLDRDLIIGNQYSKELETILGMRSFAGLPLKTVLSKIISDEDWEYTKIFIEQLYSDYVVETLITDLNPLSKIQVEVDDFAGYYVTKFLDFKFSRVYKGEDIDRILVSVADITEAVTLERRLSSEREQNDRQIEMLSSILDSDPALLNSFIKSTKQRVNFINHTLRQPERSVAAMRDKLKEIFREVHSLKGESSAMKLHSYVAIAENFESRIKELQDSRSLTGNDFLTLTVMLDELVSMTTIFDGLTKRIGKNQSDSGAAHDPLAMKKYFERYAMGVGQRNGKKVLALCQGMDEPALSQEKRDILRDLTIQLVRNAVTHGIERPAERSKAGKKPEGRVQIYLAHAGNNMARLVVEDDGNGIDYDKIRKKAIEKGLYTREQAAALNQRQLMGLLFSSGFSTAEVSNEDAGRGIGMDIVKQRINQLRGRMQLSSVPGQYTRFAVTFPLYG